MDTGIGFYRNAHVLPSALLNFSALLGWNPGNPANKGVMTAEEMVKNVSWKTTERYPLVFDAC